LAKAADAVLAMDAALAAMATGALVYAFNESKNFENSVVELKKVLGDTDDIDTAISKALELSEVYGESAGSIVESFANFVQAGYDLESSMELAASAMDLVIAGGIDAAQSSELIIAALKGFGKGADEASRYVDILNEVSNNYATDVEQLATAMSKISPIANQMGFSMEETAGLVTPIIEIFRSGDEAAVALRTGLL
jgi:TP901 family phage tail tape measure protein